MLAKIRSLILGRGNWSQRLCSILLLALAITLLERVWSFAHTLALLRAQLVLVLLALALWFAWRRAWRWGIAAGLGTLLGALFVLPQWTMTAPHAKPREGQPVLRIFSQNVQSDSANQEQVIETIRRLNPDVVVLMEVTGDWEKPLKELEPLFGADLFEYRLDPFGIAFMTKLPASGSKLHDFSGYELNSAVAKLKFDGREITVIGTHPPPPLFSTLAKVSEWHLRDLAEMASHSREPVVVMGDFNMAPGTAAYGKFLRASGLRSAGRPWESTWSGVKVPLLGVRMDHHFVSRQWRVVSSKVGGYEGSDHRWVLTELVLEEGGKGEQSD